MSSVDFYILDDDHQPVAATWQEYADWMARGFDKTKRVAETTVGEDSVSTVFLGLDHAWDGGPPVLFESMILGGDHDQEMWRYTSWDEALAGHERIVADLRAGRVPTRVPTEAEK
jgi:hypothetical protein